MLDNYNLNLSRRSFEDKSLITEDRKINKQQSYFSQLWETVNRKPDLMMSKQTFDTEGKSKMHQNLFFFFYFSHSQIDHILFFMQTEAKV